PRLPRAGELDPLELGLPARSGVDRVAVADLHRHHAVAESANRHVRAPGAARLLAAHDALEAVIDPRRAVQPLGEQPAQVLMRNLLAHVPERALVDVLQLPARVV